ncbi:MAG: hypothetical protein ACK5HT_05380, partial [Draconibacterium sp.]
MHCAGVARQAHKTRQRRNKIGYDTSRPGRFDKTISVFYNGNNSPAILQIKGRVNYPGQAVNHRDDKNIKTGAG